MSVPCGERTRTGYQAQGDQSSGRNLGMIPNALQENVMRCDCLCYNGWRAEVVHLIYVRKKHLEGGSNDQNQTKQWAEISFFSILNLRNLDLGCSADQNVSFRNLKP